ncbi:carbohydrate ABC transporter permease [Promicromonospora iranensis]|uniref:Multiple sugar transport system permease protein n=1 Tax=Promicromonospora iranensis TaxID=1105144 RepID=A0ABU2CU86_9MICO|nr:carbohydrate ABC transporter permease [Promicromonospora iranensis]MDR7384906.1 multiple sugar transport system permease protein [Promicromonospora iranensis]
MTTDTTGPATAAPPAVRHVVARPPTFRRRLRSVLKHAGLLALSLLMIYPLIWLVVASLRPDDEIFRDLSIVLTDPTGENYASGWEAHRHSFTRYFLNSAVLSIGAILGNLISCSLAAYAFARLRFPLRTLWFATMLATIMLPVHVVIVPQYVIFAQLGWINTFLPLVVPKFLATDAFFVFLMVQFIRGIPRELDEAARLDGAGHLRIFGQIILPLMVPALATTTIFTFIWTWSDFFGPLIYLTSQENWTVSLALRAFLDATSESNFGGMFAMSVLSLLPLFLAFLLGQRYLVRGFATTGIK